MKYWTMLVTSIAISLHVSAFEIKGLVQANLVAADRATSWQNSGVGILRYDSDKLSTQQALLDISQDLSSSLSLHTVLHYYQDGEQNLGLSQAALIYKPISSDRVKWQARAGFFYPKMSFENVDIGWLSPYSYTQSAINSWIGEEQRTSGLEMTAYSPGRARKSPWSWQVRIAAFTGNDPFGTIISWRGFAMHDRQSLHNDRVAFAPYPSVVEANGLWHPSWVEPFHEIDGKFGVYAGIHLDYYNKTNLRYYYYDNLGDPTALNAQRLYAWRTKYHSVALQHRLTRNTRIITQLMTGSTEMGDKFVFADFDAFYLMLSHRSGRHRLSIRYDRFIVQEDDIFVWDYNDSDGAGLTLNWRFDISSHWQLGLEQHINKNSAMSRLTLGFEPEFDQQQSLAVLQYKF